MPNPNQPVEPGQDKRMSTAELHAWLKARGHDPDVVDGTKAHMGQVLRWDTEQDEWNAIVALHQAPVAQARVRPATHGAMGWIWRAIRSFVK